MKVLFFIRHAGYIRNFESTLGGLAERGHRVHVAFDGSRELFRVGQGTSVIERLAEGHPGLSYGTTPDRESDPWHVFSVRLRHSIDYLRYLEPPYENAPKLRARAERRAPALVRRVAERLVRSPVGLRPLRAVLRAMERALPRSPAVRAFLEEQAPDTVLVTPLVDAGAPQAEYVRGASALGLPTGLCVASWDNLTNKGLIAEVPDLVTVWNHDQRREAIELHGVPDAAVVATGAQAYDHWFAWSPSSDREAFCARVGLPADRPFLLYLCSSGFIAPNEAPFVERWARELRERGGERLREAGILIRPHPQNARQWESFDASGLGPVAIFPGAGADPVDAGSKADFYDSIHHCVAVVGVNTSALIESAVVGRSVYTVLAPEFRDTQRGTLHFDHLVRAGGGLLRVAETMEQHVAELGEAVGPTGASEAPARAFLEAFVRPHGLDVAATPRLVAAIEGLAAGGRRASVRAPVWAPLFRAVLTPLVHLSHIHHRRLELTRAGARRLLAVGPVRRLLVGVVGPGLKVLTQRATTNGQGPPADAGTAPGAGGLAVRAAGAVLAVPPVRWFVTRYVSVIARELNRAVRADTDGAGSEDGAPAPTEERPRSSVPSGSR
ncbi:MAG: hypothetical protein ACR2NV_13160 [Thermoleophilaceae bacterium]